MSSEEQYQALGAGPGPKELSWWARLHFFLFKSWPTAVVEERLDRLHRREMAMRLRTERREWDAMAREAEGRDLSE